MGVLGAIFEVEMELLIKKAAATTAARVSEKCRICGKRYAKMRDFGLKSRGDSRIARKNIMFLIVFGSGMNFTKNRRGDAQATPARLAPPASFFCHCVGEDIILPHFCCQVKREADSLPYVSGGSKPPPYDEPFLCG